MGAGKLRSELSDLTFLENQREASIRAADVQASNLGCTRRDAVHVFGRVSSEQATYEFCLNGKLTVNFWGR